MKTKPMKTKPIRAWAVKSIPEDGYSTSYWGNGDGTNSPCEYQFAGFKSRWEARQFRDRSINAGRVVRVEIREVRRRKARR